MKYQTQYEKNIGIASLFLSIGIIAFLAIFLINLDAKIGIEETLYSALPLFMIGLIMFLRSFIPVKRRQIFTKKGKRYPGKIMYAEAIPGRSRAYYLLIEFYVNGRRLVRRTDAYPANPNNVLCSRECSVYEYKGKYLEGDFKMRQSRDYNKSPVIRVDVRSGLSRRKNYV